MPPTVDQIELVALDPEDFAELITLIADSREAVHEARQLAEAGDKQAALGRSFDASLSARRLRRYLVTVAVPVVEHTQELLRQARWEMRRGNGEEFEEVVEQLRRVESLMGSGR